MRLSHFIEAISLKELRVKHPELEPDLELALNKGMLNKYLGWFASHRVEGVDAHRLIELAKRFDKALASKKLDKLISQKKLTPMAKDIGWWSRPVVDMPNAPNSPSLDTMEKMLEETESLQSKKEIKVVGADKIWDDGRVVVWSPRTKANACLLGTNTQWCITEKNNPYFEQYSQKGHIFCYILDTDPIPAGREMNDVAKVAVDTNPLDPKVKWTYWDVGDDDHSEREVAAYYGSRWPAIIAAIKKYISTVEYRGGPRLANQVWLGDVLKIKPGKSVTQWLATYREEFSFNDKNSNAYSRLYASKNKKEALDATGVLLPGVISWKCKDKTVQSLLNQLTSRKYGWWSRMDDLVHLFQVVTPINPEDSVRKYGDAPQPLSVG